MAMRRTFVLGIEGMPLALLRRLTADGTMPRVARLLEHGELREEMVETQLKNRDISNELVLEAMRKVPRHLFMPASVRQYAYIDSPVPIGEGQTISQPYIVGLMTQTVDPRPGDPAL